MVSGASQIDGRSPPIDQLTSPTNSGAWGVAIVGNFVFPPSCGTPELPQGVPSHQLLPVGCPSVGILLFLPITRLPGLPGVPSHQLLPVGCPSVGILLFLPITQLPGLPGVPSHQLLPGGCSSVGTPLPGYFPFRVPIPAASLFYPLYVCTYL